MNPIQISTPEDAKTFAENVNKLNKSIPSPPAMFNTRESYSIALNSISKKRNIDDWQCNEPNVLHVSLPITDFQLLQAVLHAAYNNDQLFKHNGQVVATNGFDIIPVDGKMLSVIISDNLQLYNQDKSLATVPQKIANSALKLLA